MSRPNPTILFGFFVALMVAMCGLAAAKGGLYVGKHEGDNFHMVEIVLRVAQGQWPHLDFMTPIGIGAYGPISLFVKLGFGVGMSMILAQGLVALLLLPVLVRVGASRLHGKTAYLFGAIILILVLALVHGGTDRSVSYSMHYNRWAWGLAFPAILLALLPPDRENRLFDGVALGALMFGLALVKVTYFGVFLPPIILALVRRGALRELLIALVTGLVLAGIFTLFSGPLYWLAYMANLLSVAGSDIRSYPSEPFNVVVASPAYVAGSLLLLLSVVLLRHSGRMLEGLILLILVPGFFYVTYQNYANDPQWLLFLGVLMLTLAPSEDQTNAFGWNLRLAIPIVGGMALLLAVPGLTNLVYSPVRHFVADTEEYVPFFLRSERHDDLYALRSRAYPVMERGPLSATGNADLVAFQAPDFGPVPQKEWRGEVLPQCTVETGMIAWFESITRDLEREGYAGQGVQTFTADLFNSFWLFGDMEPLRGGAPWYYGDLNGLPFADYMIVPLCPMLPRIRDSVLEDVAKTDYDFDEVLRNDLYILYRIIRPERS